MGCGGAAPAHVALSTSAPVGACSSTESDGGFWFGEPVQPVQRWSHGCQACARLSAQGGGGGVGWKPAGGRGSPGSLLLPQVLSGRGGYSPQPTSLTPPCSLLVILAKYGLDGRKDSRVVSNNFVDHGPDDESLEDPRLEKLWHKVPSAESHPRPWRPARGGPSHPAGPPPQPHWLVVPCLPHLECLLL